MKTMIRTLFLSVLLAPVLAMAGISESYTETYALSAGASFGLDNVNGDVLIQAWDADEVQIEYTIRASSQEAFDRVSVLIEQRKGGIFVDTKYAKEKERSWRGDSASVDYHVMVPRYANLRSVETVNGDMEIDGVAGNVEASSVNGNVTASGLEGNAELDTVNGNVEAWFQVLASGQTVSMDSVNGALKLYVPGSVDADIDAESLNGSMKNDFGLHIKKGKYVGNSMYGKIGNGGARVKMENVNGSIAVREFDS